MIRLFFEKVKMISKDIYKLSIYLFKYCFNTIFALSFIFYKSTLFQIQQKTIQISA